MRIKYFCGVLRHHISQNIVAVAGTLQLNYLITLEQLITSSVEKRTTFNEQNFEVYWKTRIKDEESGIENQGSRIGIENRLKKPENTINQ